ncbi:MAG: hypothetical protein AAFW69_04160 [Pseudomonadota bacterium]
MLRPFLQAARSAPSGALGDVAGLAALCVLLVAGLALPGLV